MRTPGGMVGAQMQSISNGLFALMSKPLMPALDEAACDGIDRDVFYGEGKIKELQAKAICAQCPIQSKCFNWALYHEEFGVWGGTTRTERAKIRRERKIQVKLWPISH
jgi:WhiB family redox-sensing transcriptional regulator